MGVELKDDTRDKLDEIFSAYLEAVVNYMKKPDAEMTTINDSIRLIERHVFNLKHNAIRSNPWEN